MKTARKRKGWINDPNLTYQAEPREVKLRKIISGETSNMEDGVFPTIYTEKKTVYCQNTISGQTALRWR